MIVKERAEGYGGELGEMRNHADGVVVLLGAEPERAGADFFEELEESGDARVALGGRGISWDGGGGDERVGRVAEEVGVGLRDAGGFASGRGGGGGEGRGCRRGGILRGGWRSGRRGGAGGGVGAVC